jgi:hypothetical protein
MQSTDFLKLTEFWWPSTEAFDDLTVEEAGEGFTLTAPDDTECGEWLAHWNQSPEHIKLFTEAFTENLRNYLATIDGQTEDFTDGQQRDSEQTENVGAGSQP